MDPLPHRRAADVDVVATASTADLYRAMWTHAAGSRGRLAAAFALLVGAQLIKLAVPWFAAQAIDTLQRAGSGGAALPWIGAVVAAVACSWALHGPGRVAERSVAVRVRRALTDGLYARLAGAPLAWHEQRHPGQLQHRIAQSGRALFDFTQSQFLYLQGAVSLVGPLVALALLSSLAGGIALLGLVAIAATLFAFDRSLMRLASAENVAERRYAAALLDCLSNMATVLSLRLGASTRGRLGQRLDEVAAPLARSIVVNEWKWCAVDVLTAALSWSLVVAYAWQASAAGALLLGGVFMVYQYAQQAGSVVGQMAANLQGFARMRTDYAAGEEIRNAPERGAPPRAASGDWERIDVRGLSFAHPRADGEKARGGVDEVALSLRRGERIALVGPSGSGKSTLLRVLAGLYEPAHGRIDVDGVARLARLGLADLATYVPQEAQVFAGTWRDNLVFDASTAGDDDVAAAIEVAGLEAVVAALPDGLDTPIVAGGLNLSGGQRQRLCLARGVLAARGSHRRSLLLLDEPTSALDPLGEAIFHRRLGAAFADACVVASVHRMSLLAHFDRVVLMDNGHVVDTGVVEELAERQPLFAAMLGADPGLRDAA